MYDAIAHCLTHLIYGYYPYRGHGVSAGSLLRFDHGQYTWKTGSSQMLSSKNMRLGSNLFHIRYYRDFLRPSGGHADTALGL